MKTLIVILSLVVGAEAAVAEKIRVPGGLTGKGYTLEIDEVRVSLAPETEVEAYPKNRSLTLLGEEGRVLDVRRLPVAEDALRKLKPREWRLGITFGGSKSFGKIWHKLLLDSSQAAVGMELNYQPSLWGIALGVVSSGTETKTGSIAAEHRASTVQLGMTRLVPVGGRFHMDLGTGALRTEHLLGYDDRVVKKTFKSTSYGVYAGGDVRYVVVGNFWFSARYQLWLERVAFAELDVLEWDAQQRIMGGCHYAF